MLRNIDLLIQVCLYYPWLGIVGDRENAEFIILHTPHYAQRISLIRIRPVIYI